MLSPGGRPSERFREWIDEQLAQRQPGARLPTACECAAQWGLSRSTVTRILSEYRRKGLVVRIPRRGTFLPDAAAPPPLPPPQHRSSVQTIADHIRADISRGTLRRGDVLPSIKFMSAQFKVANRTVIRAYQDLIHQSLIVKVGKSFFVGNFTALSKAGSGRLVYWFTCDADAREQMYTGNASGLAFRRMWQELGDHGYRLCVTPLDRALDLERQWQRDSAWPDAVVFHGAGEPAFPVIQKLHRRSTRLRQNAKMPIVVDLLWGSYRQLPAGIPVFHRGNVETTLSRAAAQFIAHQNHSPVTLLFDAAGLHTISIFLLVKTAVELRSFDADCLPHLFVFNAPVPDADAFIDTMQEAVAQPRLDAILTKEHTLSLEELRKELRFAQTTQHPPRDLPPGFWLSNSERLAACARQWAGIRGWNTPQDVAILSFEDGLTSASADISSCTLDWNSTGFRLAHAVINDIPTPRSSRGFIRPQTRIVERGTT